MRVDVLYLAWNRLAFTRLSFAALLENTNWSLVRRLVVYDDGSMDTTQHYLLDAVPSCPAPSELRRHVFLIGRDRWGSPVAIMNDYAGHSLSGAQVRADDDPSPEDVVAKIDNDVVVPPGWLEALLEAWGRHPELDALGMEAGRCGLGAPSRYVVRPSDHIGGVGLIRTQRLRDDPIPVEGPRGGWTQYQVDRGLRVGWVSPDIRVASVSVVPEEPWRSLSAGYIAAGWQRPWWRVPGLSTAEGFYEERLSPHWRWWPLSAVRAALGLRPPDELSC